MLHYIRYCRVGQLRFSCRSSVLLTGSVKTISYMLKSIFTFTFLHHYIVGHQQRHGGERILSEVCKKNHDTFKRPGRRRDSRFDKQHSYL